MPNILSNPLPADLPENWQVGQIVAPNGTTVGLTEKHGYNYQSKQINAAQEAINQLDDAIGQLPTISAIEVTLLASGWSTLTQSVAATGVTATNAVIVSPDPASEEAYTDAGILCISQAEGSLTFKCDTVPEGDVTVNIVLIGGVVGNDT